MSWVGWLGLALILVAVVLVLCVAMVLVLPAGLRLRRVALVAQSLAGEYRASITTEMETAQALALERAVLLKPLLRVRRVLTHPLSVALFESYRRRRARARTAAAGSRA